MPESADFGAEDDPGLMARVRDGDRDAFVTLVRRHQNSLLNFFRRLGVHTDAEDMVQETFVRLFNYRFRYRPTAKFTTFLYLMARQVRIDALRRLQHRRAMGDRLEQRQQILEQETDSRDRRAAEAEEALGRLPDGMRQVVVLSLSQGLKYEEISEVLGIPVGTVKSRMFGALRRLRDDLSRV